MRFFQEIIQNRVLLVAVLSWFSAQALKVVFYYIIERKWNFGRFWGLGGMPSSHSSVVCGLAASIGITSGFYSAEFAISLVLAAVVMTDAAGVRRAAGKQAAVINKIVQDMIANGSWLSHESLKELLGHSPFEVLVGALLGILIGLIVT